MLESHSRALKMQIFAKFTKKTWAKRMGQWVEAQGQVKVAKKCKNTPTYDIPPSERQTKNEKKFFWCQLEDLLNP